MQEISLVGAKYKFTMKKKGGRGRVKKLYAQNILIFFYENREFQPGRVRWIFSGRKIPEHKFSGRGFKPGGPKSEISGSLKNFKPEKIGL